MRMPIVDPIVTSTFGPRVFKSGKRDHHTGVDFVNEALRAGTQAVFAVAVLPGVVVESKFMDPSDGGFGNYIVLECKDHLGNTRYLYYCHLKERFVKIGDRVDENELLAYVGNSGNSSAPHLHFEVRTARASGYYAIDPTEFLRIPNIEGEVQLEVRIKTRQDSIVRVEGRNMGDRNVIFLTEIPKIVIADTMEKIVWNKSEEVPEIK